MTDFYTKHGRYDLGWRYIYEDKKLVIFAKLPEWDVFKLVGSWPIGPVPVAELDAILQAMKPGRTN